MKFENEGIDERTIQLFITYLTQEYLKLKEEFSVSQNMEIMRNKPLLI
jgi:hypothetical protein